jgi:diadenosine tetraphosphatase ApaH/serine/threonine PP2A family protein phosphatase
MVMDACDVVITGNHDFAALYEPAHFNYGAESAAYWTRKKLESETNPATKSRRWEYLGQRDVSARIPGENFGVSDIFLVHGSPRRPINEYLFPDDIGNNGGKVAASMDRFDQLCFVGHTHVPGVFTGKGDFFTPKELNYAYDLSDKALINVGSVGQPRDRDPRAGYVILEPNKVTFVRVEYDCRKTMKKVHLIPQLDDYLGTRLIEGR